MLQRGRNAVNHVFPGCFSFAAICNAVLFLVILLFLPETLYIRKPRAEDDSSTVATPPLTLRQHISRLRIGGRFPELKLRPNAFVWPVLRMGKYPSVLFPALYYGAQYGLASILPSVTVAAIFKERYGFTVLQVGVAYGVSLTLGSLLGEVSSCFLRCSLVR